MSKLAEADIAFALDLFEGLGAVTHKRMMGGATLYVDEAIFASLDREGVIYLRSKGALADDLLAQGGVPFVWANPKTGAHQKMGYVSLPETFHDDPDAACALAARALAER